MVWASRAEQMPQVIARAFEVLSRDGNMDTTHVGLLAAQGQAGTMVRFSKSANLVTLKNVILDHADQLLLFFGQGSLASAFSDMSPRWDGQKSGTHLNI
jgi:hypothetical protein